MRDLKRSTNSLETRRIRKILNEEARLGISPNSESETEEVDLQKELHPLSHYINNREEMIEQMFSTIKGPKLKKMLPPILKDMPFDELKADCLIHLLGMSKKRIKAILDGREINSSSDSETHSDSSSSPGKRPKVDLKPFVIKQEGCSDISDNSEEVVLVDPDLDFLNVTNKDKKKGSSVEDKKKSKRKLKTQDLEKKHKRTKTKVVVDQSSESDDIEQIDSSPESASENEMEAEAPKEGKTLLEILELEMRARAIRALLKNNDTQEVEEPQKTVEGPTPDPTNLKGKSDKQLKKGTTEKITPAKNFRKKKRKNDDVIVITPKLVTIDLTDENDQSGGKNKASDREENVPSSSQNNMRFKSQEVSASDSSQPSNEISKSSGSEKTTVTNEQLPKTKEQAISEVVASCSNEKTPERVLDETSQSEHTKSSWAQRWLDSKEVKKVVSTSKICGNIRKKIKNAKLAKKQSQDEPVKPPSAPQQEMEGSVVEYKLLSKSKTSTGGDVNGATDNDTQTSVSSAVQEPTSSVADLIETSSADQVQDVSSTRVENSSASTVQDTALGLQINEGKTSSAEIESGESVGIETPKCDSHNEVLSSNINDEESIRSENICSTIETQPNTTLINNGNKNSMENKGVEENLKFPQTDLQDDSCVLVVHQAESNYLYEHSGSILNNENDAKYCESDILLTGQAVNNSEVIDEGTNKSDSNSTNDNEPNLNPETKKSLDVGTKNIRSNQGENCLLEVSETMKSISSDCNRIPIQDLNETEALEINITDEDRDIEDVIEENSEQNQ